MTIYDTEMAMGSSRSMHHEGVNLNAMEALGFCIARCFESCIDHQEFDAYRPKRTLEVFKFSITAYPGELRPKKAVLYNEVPHNGQLQAHNTTKRRSVISNA